MDWTRSELLLYGGIALMLAAAVSAVAAVILVGLAKKRLRKRLEQEFGKRRHDR